MVKTLEWASRALLPSTGNRTLLNVILIIKQ